MTRSRHRPPSTRTRRVLERATVFGRRVTGLCLVASHLALAGCGGGEPTADIVFAIHDEHRRFDPQEISWVMDSRIADCLYEPLLRVNPADLSLEPGVAGLPDVSDDGLTYRFSLRDDARWSDGTPVTSHDFRFAWRRALLPDMAADYTQLLFCIEGAKAFFEYRQEALDRFATEHADAPDPKAAEALWTQALERFDETVGIKAPDDRTLVVRLAQRTPYFDELVAFVTFMPVPKTVVSKLTSIDAESGMMRKDAGYWSDPARLVSNGPYILKRRRFRRDLLLEANPHYWDRAAMRNGSILEKIISEHQTALLYYQNGSVNWLPDLPTASPLAADLVAQNRPDVHLQPMAGVYFYNFNCKPTLPDGTPNPLADRRVRRALSMAVDRKTIVEQVTRLHQPVATTFVPPGVLPGYDPPTESGIHFDTEAARKLLAEAGYEDGATLIGLSVLYNTGHGHETIAQAIKRMWKQHLGVSVELEGVEVRSFGDRLKKQDYAISRAGWFGDYRDPTTWLEKMETGNGNNDCAYSNAEYDAVLRDAAVEPSPERRLEILRQAEAIMLEDAPMAIIFQYLSLYVYDPANLKGMTPNAWNAWRLDRVEVAP